jgi:hypothetical protein
LIAVAVLIVTRGFWLQGKLSREHVDLLSFWLPRWCAMGKGVFAGHVPTWLPNQFGGVPFASDPQSGWAYLPVLALFGATSCSRALGLLITLNPLLGLGMYGSSAATGCLVAATSGGLVMALAIAVGVAHRYRSRGARMAGSSWPRPPAACAAASVAGWPAHRQVEPDRGHAPVRAGDEARSALYALARLTSRCAGRAVPRSAAVVPVPVDRPRCCRRGPVSG